MKKITLLFISFTFISTVAFSQMIQGEIAIGGNQSDQGASACQTKDGGYAMTGYTQSFGVGGSDVYVANFDKKGTLKWAEAIGGAAFDAGNSIIQDKSGDFVIAGYTMSFGAGKVNVYVIKLDSNGNKLWTETIGGASYDEGKCIIQTKDGGYAIGGYSGSFGNGGPSDFYVIKLTVNGTIQWTKTIGGGGDEEAYTIVQTKDGGYALSGYTMSFGAGNADGYAVKLDSTGNLKWTITMGGPLGDALYGITQLKDKSYIVTGYTYHYGNNDLFLVKIDSSGNKKWSKVIGGPGNDIGEAVIQNKEGDIVVVGSTTSYGSGTNDVYLLKLDTAGTIIWTRTAGGPSNEFGYTLSQTTDDGYVVGGYTDSYGAGGDDFYLVKFDSLGHTCMSPEGGGGTDSTWGIAGSGGAVSSGGTITSKDSGRITKAGIWVDTCKVLGTEGINTIASLPDRITVYPNPTTNTLYVEFSSVSTSQTKYTLQVYDITGRVLLTYSLSQTPYPISLDVSSLSRGMYFLSIQSEAGIEVKKFMKE
ncbi:MAG TPA: T9SS type A sorting domain-containing protein [Bacteroidia bacterium]|nr:T9SS type A sorting domain-containing protein [Bacteroidia bacterium]